MLIKVIAPEGLKVPLNPLSRKFFSTTEPKAVMEDRWIKERLAVGDLVLWSEPEQAWPVYNGEEQQVDPVLSEEEKAPRKGSSKKKVKESEDG